MGLSVTVNATVDRIRKGADVETADQSKSIVSDAEIIEYINDGYRELYDIIAEYAPVDYFGTSTTLTSPYALPSDFYRELGVDYNNRTLKPFTLMERNHSFSEAFPRYRVQGASLKFNPSTFSGSVTLLYIPVASTLAAGGSFNSFDGWDVFIVAHGIVEVRRKMEYDVRDAQAKKDAAELRVRRAARRIRSGHETVLDVTTLPDEYYIG